MSCYFVKNPGINISKNPEGKPSPLSDWQISSAEKISANNGSAEVDPPASNIERQLPDKPLW